MIRNCIKLLQTTGINSKQKVVSILKQVPEFTVDEIEELISLVHDIAFYALNVSDKQYYFELENKLIQYKNLVEKEKQVA